MTLFSNRDERFWKQVTKTEACWTWTKTTELNTHRYPRIKFQGKDWLAHRWAFMRANGPIPDGLLVCHKCDNKRCVRPDHLFLGTSSDNLADAFRKGRLPNLPTMRSKAKEARTNIGKSHCWKGHPLPENLFVTTYRGKISHRCRECCRVRRRKAHVV